MAGRAREGGGLVTAAYVAGAAGAGSCRKSALRAESAEESRGGSVVARCRLIWLTVGCSISIADVSVAVVSKAGLSHSSYGMQVRASMMQFCHHAGFCSDGLQLRLRKHGSNKLQWHDNRCYDTRW